MTTTLTIIVENVKYKKVGVKTKNGFTGKNLYSLVSFSRVSLTFG